jgi:DNA modification methylase
VPSLEESVTYLDSIDWNFPRTGTLAKSIHSFHWFPGNFIPQIPAHFIQILSQPGELVLDPFVGSGTVVLEAARLGRNAVGSDTLKSCCFIAAGKLAGSKYGLSREDKRVVLEKLAWPDLCDTARVGALGEGSDPELGHWYSSRTIGRLKYIWQIIEESSEHARPVLELIFSDILFTSASTRASKTRTGKVRRHHWGWIADNVRPQMLLDPDVVTLFVSRVVAFPELAIMPPGNTHARIVRQDARHLDQATDSVDLIVTSPPYVSMIDYARANRLLYLWKGWDMDVDRNDEIGARYKRGRKSVVQDYLIEMAACWREAHRVLKPGAYIAVVIGESKRFPGTVGATLTELGQLMRPIWGPVPRTPVRRRLSDAAGSDPVEYLAVFAK